MKDEEYKRLINERDVLDRTTLNVTLKEVVSRHELELASEIQRILKNNKIQKPDLHLKPYDTTTNYYKVDLTSDHIEKIIDIFFELESSHIGENGETTPTASFYASLVDKWNELT
ncbi:hypothetical protein OCK74_13485 [Chitinophagaceae bacterium LB-8]|uniref:Uncharacterized protein n=1 Tax=Paraflavisolibacter caeni TaxID=2982496 RepID=A0A9X3B847_9BACT|nr:hypothetical protein [Paraflavisolibacter caeni]MCU7550130.1 hypothetical protein [Paraflavisolibacter caeni]